MKNICSVENAIKEIKTDYKHVLEFGVWKGNTMRKLRAGLDSSYKLFGFDSFEGLPHDWVDSDGKLVGKGAKGRFDVGRQTPDIKEVTWMIGWFDETVSEYLKGAESIAILHIDCDLYSSTKTVLAGLNSFIQSGTIIVFDEWFYNHSKANVDHEQKAFYEWVDANNRLFEFVDFEDLTDSCSPSGKKYETSERKTVRIL